jgi:hypothetical protein
MQNNNTRSKNKISTLGYFVKRMKDSGYIVWKMFNKYAMEDPRKWTILINPGDESVLITCKVNVETRAGSPHFDIYDGRQLNFKNFALITDSMEVIITHLIKTGVTPDSEVDAYGKEE